MHAGSGDTARPDGSWFAVIVFISIALYNVVELNFLIAGTFKRFRGLYFWSFLASTWGVAFNAVGYLLRHLRSGCWRSLIATLILVGWCNMVTGQSLVLYSRLHIVLHNPERLRQVLVMIVANAVWLGIPVIVLVYGSSTVDPEPFLAPYAIFERLQLTVFFVQEVVISGLYIVETARLLKLHKTVAAPGTRRVMTHLILVNVFVLVLDVSVLCLEFTGQYDMQTAWKALVYSVKLKVEFSVLNRLVELSQHLRTSGSLQPTTSDTAADVALERYNRSAPEEQTVHMP